jgi:multicomponent Na+:H+ antiporter subunit F
VEKSGAEQFFVGLAFFLLLNIFGGLIRVYRGPAPADRMITAQLFGTTGVAILLLLSEGLQQPPLRNVALVFAVLAVLTMVAFVERSREETGS